MKYFVIRDRKANASNRLFASQTEGTAIRDAMELVAKEETLRRHSTDYIVRYVGDHDVETDTFDTTDAPRDVVEVAELVEE